MKFLKLFFILMLSFLTIINAQEDDDDFEFEDEDFEFEDEDFDMEGLDDFDLEDDDFDDLLEEFELEEEEGFEEGEPRKFGLGLSVGSTIPFGTNISTRFNSGTNIGINIKLPYGFYFGPFEIIFGGSFSFINLSGIEHWMYNPNSVGYTIMNICGTAQTKILFLDVTGAIGLSPSSAPNLDSSAGPFGQEVSATIMSIIVNVAYKLPFNLGPITIDLNFNAQESLSIPGSLQGTSDLIGFGITLNYN